MTRLKLGLTVVGGLIALLSLVLGLRLAGIGIFAVTEPLAEDARRTVYENSASYVQGKVQSLSKYYAEYHAAGSTEETKTALKGVIQMQFAEFDADDIKNDKLKQFLTDMRGF
jgi:hypothetical protein